MPYSQPGKTLQMIKSPFGKEVYIVEEQVSEEKQDTKLSSKKRVESGFFFLEGRGDGWRDCKVSTFSISSV